MLEYMIHQMPQLDLIPRLIQAWHACLPMTPEKPYLPVRKILSNNMLRSAVKQCDLANTKAAINDFGADINFQDDYHETALHKACYFGHTEIVELLLTAGARTDIEDHNHQKAIDLIHSGEKKNTILWHFRFYEFLRIVKGGNKDAVKQYLADYPDFMLANLAPAKQELLFTSALSLLISNERVAIIRMLFNVPVEDGKAQNPFRSLILRCTYLSHDCKNNTDPVKIAVSRNDRAVVKLLIELGANKDDRANELTAVEFARSIGNTELADDMIKMFAKEKYKRKYATSLAASSGIFYNSITGSIHANSAFVPPSPPKTAP